MRQKIFTTQQARDTFFDEHELELEDGIPILDGYIAEDDLRHVVVWCPYCQVWHLHGTGGAQAIYDNGIEVGDGHRVAHCVGGDSPFTRGGYVVKTRGYAARAEIDSRSRECLGCGKVLTRKTGPPFHHRCQVAVEDRYSGTVKQR